MKITLSYGKEGLPIEIPDRNLVKVLRMTEKPVIENPEAEVQKKIDAPTGTEALSVMAEGKKTACIVISDITRPVPNQVILPPVLETLEKAGVPRSGITILIGTGLHRPNEGEELVKTLRDDLANIIQATKASPKKIFFYTASEWKWKTYLETLAFASKGQVKVNELMRQLMTAPALKTHAKQVSAFVQKIVGDVGKMPADLIRSHINVGILDEMEIIKEAQNFYEKEFNAEVIVLVEDDPTRYDPKDRARFAAPYRPAIFLE